jgi:hypothetical protein
VASQQLTLFLNPPYFSVPRLKIKLKGCHFDTIEVIEAESQDVPNTLREHDFQVAFKKSQNLWEQCILAVGDYVECDDGQETQS